jgi:hypothetical protein
MTDITITRGARRAAIGLFILTLIVGGANLLATFEVVHANQGEQQRQGQALERKLCTTFGRLAALKPPAGSPGSNPSRAYLQRQHATLAEIGTDLGCP